MTSKIKSMALFSVQPNFKGWKTVIAKNKRKYRLIFVISQATKKAKMYNSARKTFLNLKPEEFDEALQKLGISYEEQEKIYSEVDGK